MRPLLAAMLALAAAAAPASAADLSRAEYKAQVEPICKTNSKANERILKGVRGLVRKGKLGPAGRKFSRAAAALRRAHRQLGNVPQPTADEPRLTRWLRLVRKESDLFRKAGNALKRRKRGQAQRFVNQLTSNANRANATVLAFGFRYCRFNPAKFT